MHTIGVLVLNISWSLVLVLYAYESTNIFLLQSRHWFEYFDEQDQEVSTIEYQFINSIILHLLNTNVFWWLIFGPQEPKEIKKDKKKGDKGRREIQSGPPFFSFFFCNFPKLMVRSIHFFGPIQTWHVLSFFFFFWFWIFPDFLFYFSNFPFFIQVGHFSSITRM